MSCETQVSSRCGSSVGALEELAADGNERLKARLARKDEVIAEVTEELVRTKKAAGEP